MRSPRRATRAEERPETGELGGSAALETASSLSEATKTLPATDCRSPRAKGPSSMHFRSRTLSSPGGSSTEALGAIEDEVALLHRALAESREEAQLAARIGQTLLERNQEMDAEIERHDIALSIRAEQAEHEARNLEKKLSSAHMQVRLLEIARAKAADQAEALLVELDRSRLRSQALQSELAKTREEARSLLAAKRLAEEVNERMKDELASMHTTQVRVGEDAAKLARQMSEAAASEQERIARLIDDNAALRQQLRAAERCESTLRSQNMALQAALTAQQSAAQGQRTRTSQLDEAVERLTQELDDVKDALRQEQLCVAQLHLRTRELETQLSTKEQPEEQHGDEAASPPSTRRMRAGSLFYELSRQLSADFQSAMGGNTPESSATAPSAIRCDAATSPRSSDDERASDVSLPTGSVSARSQEPNLLKEFFMLTAAAVKISGAGLGNDACNIHNEVLYEEAMSQDVTFDQYHRWLERRLDGAPSRGGGDCETQQLSV